MEPTKRTPSDTMLTARLPSELVLLLDAIARDTDRSRNYIVREAIARYVAHEISIIDSVKTGLSDTEEHRTIPHDAVMRRVRKLIGTPKRS